MTPTTLDSLPEERLDDLVALYGDHEWWADRDREGVRRVLAGTDLFVALEDRESERQGASASSTSPSGSNAPTTPSTTPAATRNRWSG